MDFSSPVWPLSDWESVRRRRSSASSITCCCTLSLIPRATASTDSGLSKRTAKEHRTGTTSLSRSFWIISSQNRIFTDTMGVWETTTLMGSGDRLEPLDTDTVTDNAFQFLGVAPLLGRGIVPGDGKPGAPPVFVLSYKVWLSRFGHDPNVVGQTFLLNDKPTTLVGVMPQRFAFWGGDIWMPAVLRSRRTGRRENATSSSTATSGRGWTSEAAEAELGGLAKRLSTIYPRSYPEKFMRSPGSARLHRRGPVPHRAADAAGRRRPAAADCLR